METVMMSISNLRIWFGFILLGCFCITGISAKIENCPDAPHNTDLTSVKFPNCTSLTTCLFKFINSAIKGTWKFKTPTDVHNISSICTRGSFNTKQYGELIQSSKVKSVKEDNSFGGRIRKHSVSVKKGKLVAANLEYRLSPGDQTYKDSESGNFTIEILPSCKEDVKPWYCVSFTACIGSPHGGPGSNCLAALKA